MVDEKKLKELLKSMQDILIDIANEYNNTPKSGITGQEQGSNVMKWMDIKEVILEQKKSDVYLTIIHNDKYHGSSNIEKIRITTYIDPFIITQWVDP